VEENFVHLFDGGRNGTSMTIGAGRADDPAIAYVARNVSRGNGQGAAFQGVTNNTKPPVNFGAGVDGKLIAEIDDNEFTGNANNGIRFLPLDSLTGDETKTSSLEVNVHDNRLDHNGIYSFAVVFLRP